MRARHALMRWEQFHLGWVEAWSPETPIQTGEVVADHARRFGLWWLNACRIVYVVDEAEPISRFGFAYGTLPDHAGTGRSVSWSNGTVRVARSGMTSWRSPAELARCPARVSLHAAGPEAIREGVCGGDDSGGRGQCE